MESSSSENVVKESGKVDKVIDAADQVIGSVGTTWAEISKNTYDKRNKELNLGGTITLGEWTKVARENLVEEMEAARRKEELERKAGRVSPSSEEERWASELEKNSRTGSSSSEERKSSSEMEKRSGSPSSDQEISSSELEKGKLEGKVKEKPMEDKGAEGDNTEDKDTEDTTGTSEELEKTDTESETGDVFDYVSDYVPDDGGVVTEEEVDSDGEEEEHSPEQQDMILWRISFRNRNRVMSDNLAVDATSPPPVPGSPNSLSQFEKGPDGETLATYFQFRHILKESTYKNKYVIQLDAFKMTFSEREDSVLIRSDDEATVHMGTNNRNMAMEQLREILALRIRVWKSMFVSNRSAQMGEMELCKCVNMITADCLTVMMDNYANVAQIVNLHRPVLKKFTLMCCDTFPDLFYLEPIRLCPTLKLDGPSNMSDCQLMMLKADHFEITSNRITSEGINTYLKFRLSDELPERFHACLSGCGNWNTDVAMQNLDYTAYESKEAYEQKNGSIILHMESATMGYIQTSRPDERVVVVMTKDRFRAFNEGKRPELIAHDLATLE